MFLFRYFFPKKTPILPPVLPSISSIPPPTVTRPPVKKVFLVLEKNTQSPLGVFSSLKLAKESGKKTTNSNYVVIEFTVNDPCKYLFYPAFESN